MRISVVVIDDHPLFLETLVRTLSDEHDIDVVASATSVDAGLEAVRRHRPDVIVIDQGLWTVDDATASVALPEGWAAATVLVLIPPSTAATAPSPSEHHLEKIYAIDLLASRMRATRVPASDIVPSGVQRRLRSAGRAEPG